MALKNNFEFNGVNVVGGYIRVDNIAGNKKNVFFTVSYAVDAMHDALKTEQFSFAPDLESSNFIQQAYMHLKALPAFASAVDC